jgi:NADPH2:quinone reductase
MRGITMTEAGGPEVLHEVELDDPSPGPGDVVVEVAAAGLNYIDTYQRSGLYAVKLPYTPGLEGAGTVVAAGAEVAGVSVGDRVAWSGSPGSYAERARVSGAIAVPVPAGVSLEVAAAVMLQGMTAHFLAVDTFPLEPGHRCLVHAGAGGVGLLLIQIAKLRGAEVFTTVGSRDKADLVKAAGADHVIFYREEDFAERVTEIGGPKPLDVVYDGVGRETFDRSLELLRRRGTMVTFGNASGPVEPVLPLRLSQLGSLFLTRPTLADYATNREELERRSGDLFGWVEAGMLDVRIGARVPLAEAAEAHRMLEGRQTTGKVLLIP